jgi:DNA-binding response OmpR family regulator
MRAFVGRSEDVTILIITAQDELFERIATSLADRSFTLLHALSTDHAVSKMQTNPSISLLLIDSSLDQKGLFQLIRQYGMLGPSGSRHPVIIYLPHQSRSARASYAEIGCSQFLTDPFDTESLLRQIRSASAWTDKTILLLEDNVSIGESLSELLRKEKCATLQAVNCQEAMDILAREPVHLIIAEYRLLQKNDSDPCRIIESKPRQVPLILLAEYGISMPSWPDGVDTVLTKPFLMGAVRDAVQQLLTIYRSPSGNADPSIEN